MDASTSSAEQAQSPQRGFQTLEALRGIAATLVVAYHATTMPGLHTSGHHFFTFGYSGVDFFFVLSGFIMIHANRPNFGNPSRVTTYLHKRFARIYPIYWFVAFALIAAMRLFPSFTNGDKQNPRLLLHSLLLIPSAMHPLLGVTWSLSFEVAFYIALSVAILNKKAGGLLGIVWIAVALCGRDWFDSFVWSFLTDRHIIEFALGIACAFLYPRVVELRLGRVALAGAICYLLIGLANSYLWPAGGSQWDLYYGLASAPIILGVVNYEDRTRITISPALTELGAASYLIYLIHYPVLLICSRAFPAAPWFFRCIAACGLAIASGLGLHRSVEVPLYRFILKQPRQTLEKFKNFLRSAAPMPSDSGNRHPNTSRTSGKVTDIV